jgi:hypothetical protein
MSSIREQIAALTIAALQEPGTPEQPAPPGLNVHRERTRPIEQDKLPAILVYFEDEEPTPIGETGKPQRFQAPLTQRHLNLVLEMRGKTLPGQAPDEVIDPLYVWAMQRVMADERFGGLAMGVTEGPMKWTAKELDVVFAGAALHLVVHYRTSRTDPTLPT